MKSVQINLHKRNNYNDFQKKKKILRWCGLLKFSLSYTNFKGYTIQLQIRAR